MQLEDLGDAFNETYHVAGTHPQLMTMLEDMDVQIDCYEQHNRYLIPFGCVSTHIEDGTIITEPLKNFMQMYGFDPGRYEGDGLGVRVRCRSTCAPTARRWASTSPS